MKTTMKNKNATPPQTNVNETDVQEYAYHLYVQNGCIPGRDLENWLEAEACLEACIPVHLSHTRLHHHLNAGGAKAPAAAVK